MSYASAIEDMNKDYVSSVRLIIKRGQELINDAGSSIGYYGLDDVNKLAQLAINIEQLDKIINK